MITAWTTSAEQRWPDGEVPYELPGVWAVHDGLIDSIEETIGTLNTALGGELTIRPRRAGDRSYVVLRLTTNPDPRVLLASDCQRGAQPVHCQLDSFNETATLVPATLIHGLCRVLGIAIDLRTVDAAALASSASPSSSWCSQPALRQCKQSLTFGL